MASENAFMKFLNSVVDIFGKPIFNIHSLIPDSILFGSSLLYFLTQQLSYGVFAIFFIEIMGLYGAVMFVVNKAFRSSTTPGSTYTYDQEKMKRCVSGFTTPSISDPESVYLTKFKNTIELPYSMYCITAMVTYLLSAMILFKDVLHELGAPCDSQFTIAISLSIVFIVLSLVCRLWFCGLESVSMTCISMIIGIGVGIGFFYLNLKLFGKESMNFLGLPALVKTDGNVRMCVTQPKH
jgi:hypothetical protein